MREEKPQITRISRILRIFLVWIFPPFATSEMLQMKLISAFTQSGAADEIPATPRVDG
jgi:hypothetical protein